MSKKMKIIIICFCLALLCLLFIISIINRVFILTVKYNFEGKSIDCSQVRTIHLDGFDGVESCWGYGVNMQDKKIYFGIDFGGLSELYLGDPCDVDGERVVITYHLKFPKKKLHRFWKETVIVDYKKDDAGNISGTVNTANHTHGSNSELRIRDHMELPDGNVYYFHCLKTWVHLSF